MQKKKTLLKIVAAVLTIVLAFPCNVFAAQPDEIMPLASLYIEAYDAGICTKGNGKIDITFGITATNIMDEIGVTSIVLYESEDNYDWFAVKTYYSSSYSNLMGANTADHASYVTYQGTAGYYYEAHICYYAGDETGGDARQVYTKIVKAT